MIYLFDKQEQLIKVVSRKAIKTTLQKYALTEEKYISERLTVEMKAINNDDLEKVEYMAIQTVEDRHKFHFFFVAQKSSEGKVTTLIGVQSAIEELRKTVIKDKRPSDAFARDVISDLLQGTNWQARYVEDSTPYSTNFYYISTFDALKKVCQVWNLEMQFFVEMNSNKIGARYIDFKKKIGNASGKRVVYGHNALKILQEVERTNIFTALIGRGKAEQVSSAGNEKVTATGEKKVLEADGYGRKITFKDIEWSVAKGDPLDKPKGQEYLEWPEMTWIYGIKNSDGTMRPKVGVVEFGEEDKPEELIKRTRETLINTARPQLTLKTSTVYLKDVSIGDTIRVVRHDKKIDYDTRIFEITLNRLNNTSSDIKLGDRISGQDSVKAQTEAAASRAIEEFVNTEFQDFIKHLPDFLPSADGLNTNWYSEEEPTVKYPGKVKINDTWYRPDPEREGHTIMYRWTGELWEEILRTGFADILKEKIDKQFEEVNASITEQDRKHTEKVDSILSKATSAEDLAQEAKRISDEAKADTVEAITNLNNSKKAIEADIEQTKQDLIAQAKSQKDLETRIETVEETANGTKTTISDLKKTVDKTTGDLVSVEQRTKVTEDGLNGLTEEYRSSNIVLGNYLAGTETPVNIPSSASYNLLYYTKEKKSLRDLGFKIGDDIAIGFDYNHLSQPLSKEMTVRGWGGRGSTSLRNTKSIEQSGKFFATFKISEERELDRNHFDLNLGSQPHGDIDISKMYLYKTDQESEWGQYGESVKSQLAKYEKSTTRQLAELSETVKTSSGDIDELKAFREQTTTQLRDFVGRTELNDATGKISKIETNIITQAGEIAKKLSRAEVEQVVDGKGYVTSSVLENKVTENAEVFERKLTSTKRDILSGTVTITAFNEAKTTLDVHKRLIGDGNAISQAIQSANKFEESIREGGNLYQAIKTAEGLVTTVENLSVGGKNLVRNSQFKDSYSHWDWNPDANLERNLEHSNINKGKYGLHIYGNRAIGDWKGIYQRISIDRTSKVTKYILGVDLSKDGFPSGSLQLGLHFLNGDSIVEQQWHGVSSSEITGNYTRFHRVFDVPQGIDRLALMIYPSNKNAINNFYITDVMLEKSSIPSNHVPAPEDTDAVVEATKTQVSQLEGSYAIRNFNNAGDVLGQLNLNNDGSIRLNESLISIGDRTYIKDGIIKAAMIGHGQIGTAHIGEIDASRARIINLDARTITGLDANFIKAKIESALVTWLQGKVITAQNGAMEIGLNNAFMKFRANAKIEFQSKDNALYRTRNGVSAFIHFRDDTYGGAYTALGVNSDGSGTQNDYSSGFFAGIRVIRSNPNIYNGKQVDEVQLVGDTINIRHGWGYTEDYLRIQSDGGQRIDLMPFLRKVSNALGIPVS